MISIVMNDGKYTALNIKTKVCLMSKKMFFRVFHGEHLIEI